MRRITVPVELQGTWWAREHIPIARLGGGWWLVRDRYPGLGDPVSLSRIEVSDRWTSGGGAPIPKYGALFVDSNGMLHRIRVNRHETYPQPYVLTLVQTYLGRTLIRSEWKYEGMAPFKSDCSDWKFLENAALYCKGKCGAQLTRLIDIEHGRCFICWWIEIVGYKELGITRDNIRSVACPTCKAGAGDACLNDDGTERRANHIARRNAYVNVEMNAPSTGVAA